MTHTNNDERLEQEAMDQLAKANPVTPDDHDPKADALLQRITTEAPAKSVGWQKRAALAVGGFAALAAVAVGSFAVLGGDDTGGNGGQVPADQTDGDPTLDPAGGFAGTCLAYSTEELALRQFAFHGEAASVDGSTVIFEVSEWYVGDRGSEVTLELDSSLQSEMYNDFTFAEGDEYLVSGDDEFAWGCGFTRPYDEDLAAEWAAALGS
ncbi:MAG: hypothetical protein WD557_13130 [Dehalococcoidia bacterium]